MSRFVRTSELAASADEVYAWHAREGAFQRLSPPFERAEVVADSGGIGNGARKEIRVGPLGMRWVARHEAPIVGREFVDVQERGPFASWRHTHRFEPIDAQRSRLVDEIEYALPLGALGEFVAGKVIAHKLAAMFAWRHATTQADIALHARSKLAPLRVGITGARGLVGTALSALLSTGGHTVIALGRARPYAEQDIGALDAVVHLAGETIAQRWSARAKQRILASRVDGTRSLCEAIARLARPPRVVVCASAVGIYGDRGDEVLDERSTGGTGFLADVCRAWESAADPARACGIRVVHARLAPVLSPAGGALKSMLPPFRFGLGARFGVGAQWQPWVAIDDAIGAIHHALAHEELAGPLNVVAPNAVTNREFTRTLANVLHRPSFLSVPRAGARLLFGEMSGPLFFDSARVAPTKLIDSHYDFRDPTLDGALRRLLGRRE